MPIKVYTQIFFNEPGKLDDELGFATRNISDRIAYEISDRITPWLRNKIEEHRRKDRGLSPGVTDVELTFPDVVDAMLENAKTEFKVVV